MMPPRNAGRCRRDAATKPPSDTPLRRADGALSTASNKPVATPDSLSNREVHRVNSIWNSYIVDRALLSHSNRFNGKLPTRNERGLAYFVDINLRFIKDLGDPRC